MNGAPSARAIVAAPVSGSVEPVQPIEHLVARGEQRPEGDEHAIGHQAVAGFLQQQVVGDQRAEREPALRVLLGLELGSR